MAKDVTFLVDASIYGYQTYGTVRKPLTREERLRIFNEYVQTRTESADELRAHYLDLARRLHKYMNVFDHKGVCQKVFEYMGVTAPTPAHWVAAAFMVYMRY